MDKDGNSASIINSRLPWKRIFVEFIVITGGVFLGLLADDYREFRQDRKSEQEYLQLLAADLNRDHEILVGLRGAIERKSIEAQVISLSRDESSISTDSIERAMTELIFTLFYDAQSSAYKGLRDSAQLHLITSPELRALTTSYFEVHQPNISGAVSEFIGYQIRVRDRAGKYIRIFPPDRFQELRLVSDGPTVTKLIVPLPQVWEDAELMNDIAEVGARGFQIVTLINRVENLNRDVLAKLSGILH